MAVSCPDELAGQRLYWQQFDDGQHADLTTAFHAFRHTSGQDYFDAKRNPGPSQKYFDTHRTTFGTLITRNSSARLPCPNRPVRAVVLHEGTKRSISKYGLDPQKDNDVGVWWQYQGDKGWKNFSWQFMWELSSLSKQDPNTKTEMIETYIDRYLNQKDAEVDDGLTKNGRHIPRDSS